jgi:type IV pilus assembly protein PilX
MSPCTRLAVRRERGAIFFVALIVLVAMSLAGIALMRSVDTNVLIAGNLAFRQGATAGGDWGVEDARTWIGANAAILNSDTPPGASFYWANWQQNLDLIGNNPDPLVQDYDWNSTDPRDLGFDSAGNQVKYVIHRLCDTAGAPNVVQCVKSSLSGAGGGVPCAGCSNQVQPLGGGNVAPGTAVLYRVTVRIAGPRNTVSFLQAVLN